MTLRVLFIMPPGQLPPPHLMPAGNVYRSTSDLNAISYLSDDVRPNWILLDPSYPLSVLLKLRAMPQHRNASVIYIAGIERMDKASLEAARAQQAPVSNAPPTLAEALRGLTLEEIERTAILDALEQHDHNREAAARALGMGLRTIFRKIAQYRLEGYVVC